MHLHSLLASVFLFIATLSSAFVIPDSLPQFPTNSTPDIIKRQQSSIPYGLIITHCNRPGVVALTFDDGPYIYTGQMLETLSQHGARATFFLNGVNKGNIEAFPGVVQRALNEGHQLGSHTYVFEPITLTLFITQRTPCSSRILSQSTEQIFLIFFEYFIFQRRHSFELNGVQTMKANHIHFLDGTIPPSAP